MKYVYVRFAKVLLIAAFFSTGAAAAESKDFVVGVIAPMTGPLAEDGVATRNGIELARKQHPELFRGIAFIFEDSQYDAKQAVSAYIKLRTVDHVDLVYVWGNPTSEAVAPLAEQNGMPLLALCTRENLTTGRSHVVRTENHSKEFSQALAAYLQKQGYKNLALVKAENSYLNGLIGSLQDNLAGDQKLEIIASYDPGDNDFRSAISKLRSKSHDALGIFLMPGQVSQFYRQAAQQQLSLPTFGSDFFESTTEIKSAGSLMQGAVYSHLNVSDGFKKDYISNFGNDLQLAFAGNAYDIANLLADLFARQSSLSAAEIMAKIKTPKARQGVSGTFEFRDSKEGGAYFHFPVAVKAVKGDSFIVVSHE